MGRGVYGVWTRSLEPLSIYSEYGRAVDAELRFVLRPFVIQRLVRRREPFIFIHIIKIFYGRGYALRVFGFTAKTGICIFNKVGSITFNTD